MKISINELKSCQIFQPESVEQAAMIEAHDDSLQSSINARKDKKAAQQDSLTTMKCIAEKLREMASQTRYSGWFNFGMGLGMAGLKFWQATKEFEVGQKRLLVDQTAKLSDQKELAEGIVKNEFMAKKIDASNQLLGAFSNYNQFGINKDFIAVEKQNSEIAAQRADHKAQDLNDSESEAKRLAISYAKRFEDLINARHAAQIALLKG